MTVGAGSQLNKYVAHGDEFAARHYTGVCAEVMNRLYVGTEDVEKASEIRSVLLNTIIRLPLRTKVKMQFCFVKM